MGSKGGETGSFDTDVVVVGSGFGGSVAALRFAEAGHKVTVLERGDWVTRDKFEADFDFFWKPSRNRFGFNEFKRRGKNMRLIPWLGAAVGGGSHVYAATLKRRDAWDGFPGAIRKDDITPYYERAEDMLGAMEYPDWAPYDELRTTQLLFRAGEKMAKDSPDLEGHGPINLAISFAPEGEEPGATFENKHGCEQRYWKPDEQALLGGDIDAKNSLDKNYLFCAEQKHGADIQPMTEVESVEPMDGGGYRLRCFRHKKTVGAARIKRSWMPFGARREGESITMTARRVVVAAGTIGSSELLLRCRDRDKTLPDLSDALGTHYTTNGDFLSFILPYRGVFISWAGLIAAIVGLCITSWITVGVGAAAYVLGLLLSRTPFDPDLGTTNSDYMRFTGPEGQKQYAYIESGRYPTPVRLVFAIFLSAIGAYRPRRYPRIVKLTRFLSTWVPPFQLFARTWPIPLLKMGADKSYGTITLDHKGDAIIDYDWKANKKFYSYLNGLGRRVARASGAWWFPNLLFYVFRMLEIPHNQGGVPMGDTRADGVVDHAGRVFGYDDLMVMDGSFIPESPRPNPALTIAALSERAMEKVLSQIGEDGEGTVTAE